MNTTLESYAFKYASIRANLLSLTAGFPSDSIEDARQDLLLDYVRRSPRFDSSRGDRAGFVRGVMRHHATVLIARRSRRIRHEVLADDLIRPDADRPTDVLDMFDGGDPTVTLQLSLDVKRVLRQLPRNCQRLASLLPDTPMKEICATIGKSRSRIYQMIREIRAAFAAAGLDSGRALRRESRTKCPRIRSNPAGECSAKGE